MPQDPGAVGALNATLLLVNLVESSAGLYTCVGSNLEGDGQSNALHLDVTCKAPREGKKEGRSSSKRGGRKAEGER